MSTKSITTADEAADILLNAEIPRISIKRFTEQYLPLVFHADPATFNMAWLNICMKPTMAVDVIDEDGTVAYRVPPLRPSYETPFDSNIALMAGHAEMNKNVHVRKAQAILRDNLPKLMVFKSGRDPEAEKTWREIIIRHGYGDRLLTTSTSSGDSPVNEAASVQMEDDPGNDGW